MHVNTTRLRSVIAMLVAGLSLAAATGLMAAAASADTPTGGGGSTTQSKCDLLGQLFDSDVAAADAADKAGDVQGRADSLANAKADFSYGQQYGCDWAQTAVIPTFPIVRVAIGPTSRFHR
jgi:hypothetical protein